MNQLGGCIRGVSVRSDPDFLLYGTLLEESPGCIHPGFPLQANQPGHSQNLPLVFHLQAWGVEDPLDICNFDASV